MTEPAEDDTMTIELPRLRVNAGSAADDMRSVADDIRSVADDARSAASSILNEDTMRATIRSLRDAASAALQDLPDNLPDISIDRLPGRRRESWMRRAAPTIAMLTTGVVIGLAIGIWMASSVPEGSVAGGHGTASRWRRENADRSNGSYGARPSARPDEAPLTPVGSYGTSHEITGNASDLTP